MSYAWPKAAGKPTALWRNIQDKFNIGHGDARRRAPTWEEPWAWRTASTTWRSRRDMKAPDRVLHRRARRRAEGALLDARRRQHVPRLRQAQRLQLRRVRAACRRRGLERARRHPRRQRRPAHRRPGTMQHVAFNVDSLDELLALRDRIRDRGIIVFGPLDHGMCHSIYFAGPEDWPGDRHAAGRSTSGPGSTPRSWRLLRHRRRRARRHERTRLVRVEGWTGPATSIDPSRPHLRMNPAAYTAIMTMADEDVTARFSQSDPPVVVTVPTHACGWHRLRQGSRWLRGGGRLVLTASTSRQPASVAAWSGTYAACPAAGVRSRIDLGRFGSFSAGRIDVVVVEVTTAGGRSC